MTGRRRRLVLIVLTLIAGLSLAACTGSSNKPADLSDNDGSGTFQGFGVTPPQPRPQFTLKDTSGKTFKFGAETAGHPTLLFFGYTTCPDVCPTTMADIMLALKAVPPAVAAVTDVVFVTTDVKTDTASRISDFLRKFDGTLSRKFIGLYGTQGDIDTAQTAAHVTLAEDGGQSHSASVLLYGSDDYARVSYAQSSNESDQIAHDLPLVAGVK